MAAARRLVLHSRAATADEARHHKSEEVHFWEYVWGSIVAELCKRAVNIFFTSASHRNGMGPLLIQVGTYVKQYLTPVHVEAGKPLEPYMVHRGEASHGIFYGVTNALLPRCSRYYLTAVPMTGRSRGSAAVLSQSQRLPLGQSATRGFPSKEERGGGGKPPTREPPKAWTKKV